ncbi:hypothetical protein COLO4_17140 [Corchorus olitorius]|uniref:Uncharacterized protein n=1 Tax=Corchorus olitorius TaxID=93759 RepID=A0A1R3JE24_9ROSI|nr:hypothetical protein COLO4_17140 [Corchorus olitorius]
MAFNDLMINVDRRFMNSREVDKLCVVVMTWQRP